MFMFMFMFIRGFAWATSKRREGVLLEGLPRGVLHKLSMDLYQIW